MQKLKKIGDNPFSGLKVQSNDGETQWRKEMAQAIEKKKFNDSVNEILREIAEIAEDIENEKRGFAPSLLKYTFGATLHFPYKSMK